MGGSVPFNIRELCLPLATQAIVHGTNETNGQTIDVGGIVPVEFFLTRFLLLRMCGKKSYVGMVSMKVLESCSRTEDVITYENNRCGVCRNNRCGVCRCLPLARLWTTPIDVGCAVASHCPRLWTTPIDVGCAVASRCLVYRRLHSTHLWTTCTTIHWFAFWKSAHQLRIFTWTPSFGCRPVASSICEFVRFLITRFFTFMWEFVAWLFLNPVSRVVSFLSFFFFSFFFPLKKSRKHEKK